MADPDEDVDALMARMEQLQSSIDACNGWEIDRVVDRAMEALRVPPPDSDVDVLSGGERRRVALCRLVLEDPDVLLLHEPTNHLDAESVAWLEKFLAQFRGTVVAVTHDRYFLDNGAGRRSLTLGLDLLAPHVYGGSSALHAPVPHPFTPTSHRFPGCSGGVDPRARSWLRFSIRGQLQ